MSPWVWRFIVYRWLYISCVHLVVHVGDCSHNARNEQYQVSKVIILRHSATKALALYIRILNNNKKKSLYLKQKNNNFRRRWKLGDI
jgi:hypothetical protein